MQQQKLREVEFAGRVAAGMDVCDVSGDKIGTVAHLHTSPEGATVVEVKTGILGLGKHLFVPLASVEDMTDGCLFLSVARVTAEHEFTNRPGWLS